MILDSVLFTEMVILSKSNLSRVLVQIVLDGLNYHRQQFVFLVEHDRADGVSLIGSRIEVEKSIRSVIIIRKLFDRLLLAIRLG